MIARLLKRTLADIGLVLILTGSTLAVVFLPVLNQTVARTVIAVLFLFVAPGYAFVAALFPAKNQVDLLERLVFSVASSTALIVLVGLLLNYTPWGVNLYSLTVSFSILVSAFSMAAVWRRTNQSTEYVAEPLTQLIRTVSGAQKDLTERWNSSRINVLLMLGVGLLLVFSFTYVVVTPLSGERFTELYVTGPNGSVEGIPTTSGGPVEVRVGIRNHEHRPEVYRLVVRLNGSGNATRVKEIDSIMLDHGESWNRTLVLGTEHRRGYLEFLLFRKSSSNQPYRINRVRLTPLTSA